LIAAEFVKLLKRLFLIFDRLKLKVRDLVAGYSEIRNFTLLSFGRIESQLFIDTSEQKYN